ncbi:TonB-dependent receptor [Novosphingobium sp. SG720]|uniref:TonB-dependent receptor n=1 Tax=Novosphingobium sp. SG720 TaxID=2586998 RepID=UPI001446C407|nr:TonB-dependent receptor [Novosphingobium sp. SG720]NKJ41507.1 iron complex outermembrane receptor protein [Novosphingobium sp. SG720]
MRTTHFAAAMLAGAALAAIAPAAFAQDTAPAAADTAAETGDAIVVTAERRQENIMSVPVSVAVMKPELLHNLQAAGADTLLSLAGRVPSLNVESTTGRIFPRFYIRGLGNIDFYLGASQPVSVIQDDVVMEHVVLKSNPAFDIAQVEVLRGPQGSLFGRNTTAGIVKFDTAQPTATWQGQGSASWGSRNAINVDAGVGGPLTSDGRISFRLSGLYQHRDNWINNTYTGVSDDGTKPGNNVMGGFNERDVRLQLLVQPTETLSLRVSGHYRDYDGSASIFYRGSIQKGTHTVPENLDLTNVAYDEGGNNPQAYKTKGVSLKAVQDFGGATLTSITAYEASHGSSRGDTDGGAAANFGGAGYGESRGVLRSLNQWSQELRLASPDAARFKWQFGGIYFDSRDYTEFDQRAYFLTSNALGTTPNPNNWVLLHNVNTSWAVFGQASYDLTEKLRFTAGARLSNDTKTTSLLKTADTVGGVVTFPSTAPRTVRLSDTQPSFDASLLYRANSDLSFFARVARGFRGPTIQGRSAVFNSAFTTANSEKNTSWEAGVKSAWLDNAVTFNLTGFYYTVTDIQLNGNDSNGSGVLFNADKAVGYGAEAELGLRPATNLRFDIGVSVLHTEVKDSNVYAQAGSAGGVLSETVLNPVKQVGANYFAQINGNPLPNAPKFNLNISGRYDLPLSDDFKAFVGGDFNLQGYTMYVPYKTVEYTSNGNYELGAKAGFAWGRYELAVFARNLTDKRNLIGVIDTSNYRAGIYNDPRTIGVSLSGSFR